MLLRPTLLAIAAMAAAAASAAPAPTPTPVNAAGAGGGLRCNQVNVGPVLQVPVGKSVIVRPDTPMVRIVLGNPDNASAARPSEGGADTKGGGASTAAATASPRRPGVADVDVLLLGPGELYLLGKSVGSTNVVTVDRRGACTTYDVVVGMDTTALQTLLRQVLPDEKDVQVTAAFDSIVLTGTASDSEALTRITDLANAFVRGQQGGGNGGTGSAAGANPRIVNMLGVGAPQQVMLEVKVAEISKSLLDQFGIDFSRALVSGNGAAISFLSGLLGGGVGALGRIAGTGPTGVPFSSSDVVVGGLVQGISGTTGGNVTLSYDPAGRPVYTTTYGTIPGRSTTNVNLNMQKTDGLVKVLAEPSVMAISGQTGSFLAGGKIFIPVAQTTANGNREVTLEEKEFGVSVKFTPTVLGNGRINLRVRPEVSELNGSGVTIAGVNGNAVLPAFTSRKAETTVQLMDGQSFAIGGLIKNNTTTNVKAFPFLGELPLIGALFRSTEFQTDRSELVFVITPRLVKPLPPDFRLPTDNYVPPTRKELILEGRTEGRAPAPATGTGGTGNGDAGGGGFDLSTPTPEKK